MNDVSIQQSLADIRTLLHLSNYDEDDLLLKLICDAARLTQCTDNLYPLFTTIPLINDTALLPNGIVVINSVRLNDGSGYHCYPCYTKCAFPIDKNSTNVLRYDESYSFTVQNNYLVFSSNVTQQSCKVNYIGMQIDTDGFPLITNTMELAVQEYVLWRYKLLYSERFTSYVIESHRNEWRIRLISARNTPKKEASLEHVGAAWNRFFVQGGSGFNNSPYPYNIVGGVIL